MEEQTLGRTAAVRQEEMSGNFYTLEELVFHKSIILEKCVSQLQSRSRIELSNESHFCLGGPGTAQPLLEP